MAISTDDIRQLVTEDLPGPVLSVLLRTDPRDPANTRHVPRWQVALRTALQDITAWVEEHAAREERLALRTLQLEVQRKLAGLPGDQRGRGIAWFVSPDRRRDRRFTLQLPPSRDSVRWDTRPFVSPLVELVDHGRPVAIVLIALDSVRLLAWEGGRVTEPPRSVYDLELGDWRDYAGYARRCCWRTRRHCAWLRRMGGQPVLLLRTGGAPHRSGRTTPISTSGDARKRKGCDAWLDPSDTSAHALRSRRSLDAPFIRNRSEVMAKPILVGFDPRTADRAPVDFGLAAARFTGAPLVVGCVCAARTPGRPAGEVEEDLAEEAAAALEQLQRELETDEAAVTYRELQGTSAARALHEAAEQQDAGLLVVGSTRRAALGRLLPGSTADRLMHGAPCPIAVIPTGWQPRGSLTTIGVAYVDTPEGREALRGAHALANRAAAALRVLTVAKVDLGGYGEAEPQLAAQRGKEASEVAGEHRVFAERAARAAVEELDAEVEVQVDAFLEDPAESLIRVSEHLDLLVCGSRGYGPLRAVLLGGVSRRVAAEAHCPVIVLPRGVEAALEALMTTTPGTAVA